MTPPINLIKKVLAPVQRRVALMVSRAVVKLLDNSTACQTLQVSLRADELRDGVERFGEYGFASSPSVGAEAIVLMVGGDASHPVAVATEDRRYRPRTLAEGESCLYTLANGIRVLCKANGEVHVGTNPTDFVALATPTKAEITALRNTVNALVTAYNAHTHAVAGVTAGGASVVSATTTSAGTAPAAVGDVKAIEVKAL